VVRLWCAHSSRFTGDTVIASDPGHTADNPTSFAFRRTMRGQASLLSYGVNYVHGANPWFSP